MANERFVASSNERMRYGSAIANVNLHIFQSRSAVMDKHEIRNVKDRRTTGAHTISDSGARMECSTENASNVMPQILVGVRSSITCLSSMRHLVNACQVFCGACTGQGAPSLKPHAWSGCACVSTIALGCSRSNFP